MRTEDGTLGQRPESLMYNPERSSLAFQAQCKQNASRFKISFKQIQAQQGKPWKTLEKLHSRDWPAPNSVDFWAKNDPKNDPKLKRLRRLSPLLPPQSWFASFSRRIDFKGQWSLTSTRKKRVKSAASPSAIPIISCEPCKRHVHSQVVTASAQESLFDFIDLKKRSHSYHVIAHHISSFRWSFRWSFYHSDIL